MNGHCTTSDVPINRLNADAFHKSGHDNAFSRGGHFLNCDIGAFDAPFFSISAAEAVAMDPLQRGLLETTYHALENSGYPFDKLRNTKTSVYTGCFTDDYNHLNSKDPEQASQYSMSGLSPSILANRISWFFNFTGASVNINTACSSSLVALDLACQSLMTGESEMSIVAGCNLIFSADMMLLLSRINMSSPNGRCFSFDDRANGYARGEGFAVIVLKRVADAISNGDTLRAVIRSTGTNQNGHGKSGLTRPSKGAQESLIRETYQKASLRMDLTRFVEAHGTGTPVGDPIEIDAISAAFHSKKKPKDPLIIGAVKSNIGHLEGASGLAGLIKTILVLEHAIIPPNTNFERTNQRIDPAYLGVMFPIEPIAWPTDGARRASVNSFGFGGTNAHVVVDDAFHFMEQRGLTGNHNSVPRPPTLVGSMLSTSASVTASARINNPSHLILVEQKDWIGGPKLLIWSAADQAALERLSAAYSRHFSQLGSMVSAEDSEHYLKSLAYTLSHRRSSLSWKSSMVVDSLLDLQAASLDLAAPICSSTTSPRVGYIFTGQGAQWAQTGKELLGYSVFSGSLRRADRYLQTIGCPWALIDELLKDELGSKVHLPEYSQPLCTAIQVALVDLLRSFNVFPSVVVGHSSGEIAAAYCKGAISSNSALKLAYYRGTQTSLLSKSSSRSGAMVAVGLSESEALPYIDQVAHQFGVRGLTIACFNSDSSITISGDKDQVDALETLLIEEKAAAFVHRLKVNVAYHSAHMNDIASRLQALIQDIQVEEPRNQPETIMISTVTAKEISKNQLCSAEYWIRNLVSSVHFGHALSQLCKITNSKNQAKIDRSHLRVAFVDVLIEIGPHSALRGPVRDILKACSNDTTTYKSALVRKSSASRSILDTMGHLHCRGCCVDFGQINQLHCTSKPLVALAHLPQYPFDHSKTYWSESRISRSFRFRKHSRHELLGKPISDWNPIDARWCHYIKISEIPWVMDHQIQDSVLYPAAGMVVMAIEAANQLASSDRSIRAFRIKDTVFKTALLIPLSGAIEVQFSLRAAHRQSSLDEDSDWSDFRVHSYQNGSWVENCYGNIRVDYEQENTDSETADRAANKPLTDRRAHRAAVEACQLAVDASEFYQSLERCGFNYGNSFRSLEDIRFGEQESVARVRSSPDTRTILGGCIIHPTTLDGLFQLALPVSTRGGSRVVSTKVPIQLRSLKIVPKHLPKSGNPSLAAGIASARILSDNGSWLKSDVSMLDQAEEFLSVKLKGLQLTAIASPGSPAATRSSDSQLHSLIDWRPDLRILDNQQVSAYCEHSRGLVQPVEFFRNLDHLIRVFIVRTLNFIDIGMPSNLSTHMQKYVDWIRIQGQLIIQEQQSNTHSSVGIRFDSKSLDELCTVVADANDLGRMYVAAGRHMWKFITGVVDPLSIFFQDDLLRNAYQELHQSNCFPPLARYLDALAHQQPAMKILEIGAGTGATTAFILQSLQVMTSQTAEPGFCHPRCSQYDFTDISEAFFERARGVFGEFEEMTFRALDIGNDPVSQGFAKETYDLIIASNARKANELRLDKSPDAIANTLFQVLHATSNLSSSIQHVRSLLKPYVYLSCDTFYGIGTNDFHRFRGGKLVLFESTRPKLARIGFAMGVLPGWWLGVESFRKWTPIVTLEKWHQLLSENGFSGTDIVFRDYEDDECHEMSLFISTATIPASQERLLPGVVILIPDSDSDSDSDSSQTALALGHEIRDQIRSAGFLVHSVLSPTQVLSIKDSKERIYISTLELQRPFLRHMSNTDFGMLQAILGSAKGIIWVAQGARFSKNPDFALVDGLARVIRRENYRLVFVTIAFESCGRLSSQQVKHLCQVLSITDFESRDYEAAYVETTGILQIGRVIEDQRLDRDIAKLKTSSESKIQEFSDSDPPLEIVIRKLRSPDDLPFNEDATCSKLLSAKKAEAHFQLNGMLSRDCFSSMGRSHISTHSECACAGLHIEAREDINLRIDERTRSVDQEAYKSVLRSHHQCAIGYDDLSFDQAAAIPCSFLTAYLILESARIKPDDSMLVHLSTNGIGHAAIQLAHHFGITTTFATVISNKDKQVLRESCQIPEDQIFIRSDSSFVQKIKQRQRNGVNIVLNFALGSPIQNSWGCVAFFGQVFDLVMPFGPNSVSPGVPPRNIAYAIFHFEDWLTDRRDLVSAALRTIVRLFVSNQLQAASPVRVLPMSNPAEQACKPMIDHELKPRFDRSKTYLIAGGLGGIGRSIARWMVDCGARYLILLSRSGPSSSAAKALVEDLEAQNAKVKALACDVAIASSLEIVLKDCSKTMPPIKGCIQASMVLKDALFENMTYEDWKTASRPKVDGSWNLHNLLPKDLDFFILLSSLSGIVGQLGQSNYAAGNTYQDALAQHRIANNEKAVSLDLGTVLSAGYLTRKDVDSERVLAAGHFLPLFPEDIFALLDHYCHSDVSSDRKSQAIVGLARPSSTGMEDLKADSQLGTPLFSHLCRKGRSSIEAAVMTKDILDPGKQFFAAKTMSEAGSIVTQALVAKLSRTFSRLRSIDLRRPMLEYGVDSLAAVELRNWLASKFNVDVPIFEIMGGASFASIGMTVAEKSGRNWDTRP